MATRFSQPTFEKWTALHWERRYGKGRSLIIAQVRASHHLVKELKDEQYAFRWVVCYRDRIEHSTGFKPSLETAFAEAEEAVKKLRTRVRSRR